MKLLIKIYILFILTFSAKSQGWENVGNAIDNNVYDMINFNGNLFVGGRFSGKVKSWNGSSWTNYPTLFGIGSPLTFSIYKDTLYAGGDFPYQSTQSRVYRLVNGGWQQVGGAFDQSAWSSTKKLITFDTLLISGGRFSSIDGSPISNIASWDGLSWNSMGAGLNGMVHYLEVHNDKLYVTGEFSASGVDTSIRNIACWNGNSWECFDTSVVFTTAYAMKSYDGDLLIGNVWNNIEGIDMNGITRWNGVSYSSMGDVIIKKVHEFHEFNGDLYIAADLFGSSSGVTDRAVLKWSGTSWIQIGSNFNEWIMCLESYDYMLYCGGQFSAPVSRIGRFNNSLGIDDFQIVSQKVIKVFDLMGRKTEYRPNTFLIYLYEDGSTEKVYISQ